jgi:multidrug resistance protein, MATE family
MIGTMGVSQLSTHTIPSQVMGMTYMIHLGIGIAVSIRVGNVIPQSVSQTKLICVYAVVFSSIVFAIIAILTYIGRSYIYSLFTTEQDVIDGCEQIWFKVSLYSFNMGIYTVVDGISTGLGKQWLAGYLTILFMFVLGIPSLYYFAVYKEGGLDIAWLWLLLPNIGVNVALAIGLALSDWDAISAKILEEDSDSEYDENYGDVDDDDDDDSEIMSLTADNNKTETPTTILITNGTKDYGSTNNHQNHKHNGFVTEP